MNYNDFYLLQIMDRNCVVGSAAICKRMLHLGKKLITVSFCSQVFIEEKYRGLGHFYKLMGEVNKVEKYLGVTASVVIARKKVGNIYSKTGYLGFGSYPVIKIQNSDLFFLKKENIALEDISDDQLRKAYYSTYQSIPGTVSRENEMFETIKYGSELGIFEFKSSIIRNKAFYFIVKNNAIIEAGCEENDYWDDIAIILLKCGYSEFRISETHPLTKKLLKYKPEIYLRREFQEGHMYKMINTVQGLDIFETYNFLNRSPVISESNVSAIDINELNQW
jgi:hypothetical protein